MALQQIAIVTGGSRGIGQFVTNSLARTMPVLSLSRSGRDVPATDAKTDYPVHRLAIDLSDLTELEKRVGTWLDEHPNVRVASLILNAADLSLGLLRHVRQDDLETVFRTNVFSSIILVASILRRNAFHEEGSQVTYLTSSLARMEPALTFAGIGLYSATKAAVARTAMVQAREFSLTHPYIRVARVHPGIVDTDMQNQLRANPDLDPLFVVKTAGLPPYRPGDWARTTPADEMRTITAEMSADFVLWASSRGDHRAREFDYYLTADYHTVRDARLAAQGSFSSTDQLPNRSKVSS